MTPKTLKPSRHYFYMNNTRINVCQTSYDEWEINPDGIQFTLQKSRIVHNPPFLGCREINLYIQ